MSRENRPTSWPEKKVLKEPLVVMYYTAQTPTAGKAFYTTKMAFLTKTLFKQKLFSYTLLPFQQQQQINNEIQSDLFTTNSIF